MWTAIDSFKGISKSTSITFRPLPTTSECTKLSHILRSLSKRNHLFSYMYITSIQFMYGSFCCIFFLDILGIPKTPGPHSPLHLWDEGVEPHVKHHLVGFVVGLLVTGLLVQYMKYMEIICICCLNFSSLVNEYIPFHWKSVQNPKTWMWTVF